MVDVAQLVEPRIVIPVVVGSSPIVHPNLKGMIIMYQKIIFWFTSLFLTIAEAAQTPQNTQALSLGEASNELMGPVRGITHLVNSISILAGLAFLAGALFQYMNHRKHPTQVPISKPIIFLVLGLLMVGIPLLARMTPGAPI